MVGGRGEAALLAALRGADGAAKLKALRDIKNQAIGALRAFVSLTLIGLA